MLNRLISCSYAVISKTFTSKRLFWNAMDHFNRWTIDHYKIDRILLANLKWWQLCGQTPDRKVKIAGTIRAVSITRGHLRGGPVTPVASSLWCFARAFLRKSTIANRLPVNTFNYSMQICCHSNVLFIKLPNIVISWLSMHEMLFGNLIKRMYLIDRYQHDDAREAKTDARRHNSISWS